jgi:acyl-CoA reductase-like NAD-dependent aldehyde dehydrogenase
VFTPHPIVHPSLTFHDVTGLCFAVLIGGDTGIGICKKAGMIPIQMELGGKDVCIVCADADIDLAAANIIKGGFSYSGQRCTAVKCVLVLDSVADVLVEKVKAGMAKLSVGKPEVRTPYLGDASTCPATCHSSIGFSAVKNTAYHYCKT